MAPKRKPRTRRSRRSWLPKTCGRMILSTEFVDNVKDYTTFNINASTVGLLTDRPHRMTRVWLEFSTVPDAAQPEAVAHSPVFNLELITPDNSPRGRTIYRVPPTMVPLGVVRRLNIRVPYTPPVVAVANTTLCRITLSGSAGLAVTFNLFVEVIYSWATYTGLTIDVPPPLRPESQPPN